MEFSVLSYCHKREALVKSWHYIENYWREQETAKPGNGLGEKNLLFSLKHFSLLSESWPDLIFKQNTLKQRCKFLSLNTLSWSSTLWPPRGQLTLEVMTCQWSAVPANAIIAPFLPFILFSFLHCPLQWDRSKYWFLRDTLPKITMSAKYHIF